MHNKKPEFQIFDLPFDNFIYNQSGCAIVVSEGLERGELYPDNCKVGG
jgi:hypothetical protein